MATNDVEAALISEKKPLQKATWGQELRGLLRLAGPSTIQLLTQQGMILTGQVLNGHLGRTELAAAAIGTTVSQKYGKIMPQNSPLKSNNQQNLVCSCTGSTLRSACFDPTTWSSHLLS